MRFEVLGPLQVRDTDGALLSVRSTVQRRVLAVLLARVAGGRAVVHVGAEPVPVRVVGRVVRAWIADVTQGVAVGVLLAGVGDVGTVVRRVAHRVAVDVGQEVLEKVQQQARGGASSVVARLNPRTHCRKGERIELVVDTRRLHFFDPQDGTGLYSQEAM